MPSHNYERRSKILIIGNAVDRHLIRLINNLKKYDYSNNLIIDVLHINSFLNYKLRSRLSELTPDAINKFYCINDPKIKNRFIGKIIYIVKLVLQISKMNNCEYDLANIHYMSGSYFFIINMLKRKTKKILITPWGSDVYRVSGLNRWLINKTYKSADQVSFECNNFKNDIKTIYSVPEYKFIELSFGSEIIDLIYENYKLTREEAKKELNISGYVIVCGYNASPAQQHLKIIKGLKEIHQKLPCNTILVFPMTYAKNEKYINLIREELRKSDFKYILYEEHMSGQEVLYLRKSADIFINLETTDSFSASLQEFLLANANVIIGSWLKYPDLEKWGVPYLKINNLNELGESILKIIYSEYKLAISDELKSDIVSRGFKSQIYKWIYYYMDQSSNMC